MRRYRGHIADSIRWQRFPLRDDDVIITTPSKCGTTWMQTIVGMLLFGRVDLGKPMALLSPWLDMRTRSTKELFGLLGAQEHRRFIKTHTPLDGLPWSDSVTYLAVIRHPLDAALSNKDHNMNWSDEREDELRSSASLEDGEDGADGADDDEASDGAGAPPPLVRPDDPAEYLRWWIDSDYPATGTGLNTLADFAQQARTYWDARQRPNVHLFHFDDLQSDLDGEMRRVAAALGVPVGEASWGQFVRAAGLDAMRSRAEALAPEAHLGIWRSVEAFFKEGGRRNWAELLTPAELAHYERRLADLAGEDTLAWITRGRAAFPEKDKRPA